MNTLIQWPSHKYWNRAYNPVVGCKKISEGCQNCYAQGVVERFVINGGDFTPTCNPNAKPPRKGVVFVGNMTDMFGEWNTSGQIVDWLGGLDHYSATNLVLTKRAARMSDILERIHNYESIMPFGKSFLDKYWWGVTAENQQRADERISSLLKVGFTPKTDGVRLKRWLSLEPLLGDIKITPYIGGNAYLCDCGWHETERNLILASPKADGSWGLSRCCECRKHAYHTSACQWVVVGAESGPNRRPCKLEWIESIVQQCREANIPVFVKQIELDGKLVKDISKFPEHLRIRQVPWAKQEACQ